MFQTRTKKSPIIQQYIPQKGVKGSFEKNQRNDSFFQQAKHHPSHPQPPPWGVSLLKSATKGLIGQSTKVKNQFTKKVVSPPALASHTRRPAKSEVCIRHAHQELTGHMSTFCSASWQPTLTVLAVALLTVDRNGPFLRLGSAALLYFLLSDANLLFAASPY